MGNFILNELYALKKNNQTTEVAGCKCNMSHYSWLEMLVGTTMGKKTPLIVKMTPLSRSRVSMCLAPPQENE